MGSSIVLVPLANVIAEYKVIKNQSQECQRYHVGLENDLKRDR